VAVQKSEDDRPLKTSTQELQNEMHSPSHVDTASQQADNDKLSELDSEKKWCQWIMAKANSLNEVNSRDLDELADRAHARVSLDAESGPTANRRRRKRFSPSCNNALKVSMKGTDDDDNDNNNVCLLY